MPRFFVSPEAIDREANTVKITDDATHISRSLRMAEGDEIIVCDGFGAEYRCTLSRIRDEECECKIMEISESGSESPLDILLCMAYPKSDKLETIIQKAVELGASTIIPFESSRCIKRPKADKIDKVAKRLQRIAEEAAKQCGRARIPKVCQPVSFREMLREATECDISLFCYECEDQLSLKDVLRENGNVSSVSVIVGAEGGFSKDEAELAMSMGAKSVSLGRRILRCETAPTFVLSILSYAFEI